jgi:hypothetical protein
MTVIMAVEGLLLFLFVVPPASMHPGSSSS